MSLKIAAEHLKAQGRGPDTELIHMTKGEIKGLRQLAQAHGKDLTTNPTTGLPEAGILSAILPAAIGIGTAIFAPELLPLVAGGVGLADYAMTGSLSQGLMAGFSAWGAGSFAGGLGEMGAAEAGAESGVNAGSEALQAAPPPPPPEPVGANAPFESNYPTTATSATQFAGTPPTSAANAADMLKNGALTPEQYSTWASGYGQGVAGAGTTPWQNMVAGATPSNIGTYAMGHLGQTAAVAAPLLSSALTKSPTQNGGPAATNNTSGYGQPLQRISPNFQGSFPAQPNPAYQAHYPNYVQNPYNPNAPTQMAVGGIADSSPLDGMASGGPSGMFPQSQIQKPQYSQSSQMPLGAQAVAADYDPKTNPLTGEPVAMAGGGILAFSGSQGSLVNKYDPQSYMGANNKYDPQNYMQHYAAPETNAKDLSTYQDSDPDTVNLDALSAALTRTGKINAAAHMPTTGIKAAMPKAKRLGSEVSSDSYMAQLAAVKQAQAAQQPATQQLPEVESAAGGGIMQGYAHGGMPSLGSYSDGGHLLKGPGDGMSDSIPAQIGAKQPARLADGEFVIPADVVSHLGNGSTEAGAKHLYAMMDKIRKARTGRKKQAPQVNATKYIPK